LGLMESWMVSFNLWFSRSCSSNWMMSTSFYFLSAAISSACLISFSRSYWIMLFFCSFI
jgi:hypothetical protein